MGKSEEKMPARFVKFLGTAGARFVVARQLRSSAGTWLRMAGQDVIYDPGPGTIVRCWAARPHCDATKVNAIVMSHHHLDHAGDANVMIEAMTDGGTKRVGLLLAPNAAYEDDSPLCRYVQRFPAHVEKLSEGSEHEVGGLRIKCVAAMQHGVETCGTVFSDGEKRVGFAPDTYYIEGVGQKYRGCDVLVVNCVLFSDHGPGVPHLNPSSAARVIGEAKPKVAVLTHFGMNMLRNEPRKIAEEMTREIGIEVKAAGDGMMMDLDEN
jgi:phosphoribosyl 1,2-cyclic phosphodiesterase